MPPSWWQLEWIWIITAWVLTALGGTLILFALFRDRSRGRRRCPKCWYDMSGVPARTEAGGDTFTCPECGRRSTLRSLYRTRRKWKTSAVAVLILICAWAAASWRDYAAGGWVRLIPGTVLAIWAPTEFSFSYQRQGLNSGRPLLGGLPVVGTLFTPASAPRPPRERIGEEVWRRVFEGRLWHWQSQMFIERALREQRIDLARHVHICPRWPAGEKIPVFVDFDITTGRVPPPRDFFGLVAIPLIDAVHHPRGHRQDVIEVPVPTGPNPDVAVPIEFRTPAPANLPVCTVNVHRPVTISENWDTLFTHDSTPETSQRVQQAMDPRLCIVGEDVTLVLDDRSNSPRWKNLELGLGCRIEVTVDGHPAATGVFRPQWRQPVFKSWEELRMEWQRGMKTASLASPDKVRVVVRGDTAISGEIYRMWPFVDSDPSCWTGSFELTPRIVARPEKLDGH